jgi:hypothetical protein
VHQEPIVGQTNYAYVRIKNRGTTPATKVVVKGFHALPGVGLVYPTDWTPMATPQLTAPNLAAHDAVGVVVGPFKWVPSQVGHECMFFSVSAKGDASNIDGAITGPIPEWRLVPHDNNIAQRNVHPVFPQLVKVDWKKLPFWIRNHGRLPVRLGLTVKVPNWLGRLGWKFSVPQITKDRAVLKPDQLLKVNVAMTKGKPYNTAVLAKQADHDIVFTVLQDGMPVGGMTYRLSADAKQGLAAPAKVKTTTVARSANARRAVKTKSVASRSRPKKTRYAQRQHLPVVTTAELQLRGWRLQRDQPSLKPYSGTLPLAPVISVRQEFSGHRDLDAVALRIGGALQRMSKSIADMMPSPNSSSISAFHAGPLTITSS